MGRDALEKMDKKIQLTVAVGLSHQLQVFMEVGYNYLLCDHWYISPTYRIKLLLEYSHIQS